MTVYIGIDLGGTTAKFGLFDAKGHLCTSVSIPTGKEKEQNVLIHEMAVRLRTLLAEENLAESELGGIGIGVPGPVVGHTIVNGCVNLRWGVVPLVEVFREQEEFTCPIIVENDADVAALGEVWQGAASDKSSIVFVIIGTGIGGGIVLNNQILSGTHGAGGEIGHMPVLTEPLGFSCGCGGHYCLEQVCSAPNILRYAGELLAQSDAPSSLRPYNGGYDTRAIFRGAANGDAICQQVVNRVTDVLGRGLAILGSSIDPECFVIGGGVSNAGDVLMNPLREAYRRYAFFATRETPIVRATLGNKAGMIGAARLVFPLEVEA